MIELGPDSKLRPSKFSDLYIYDDWLEIRIIKDHCFDIIGYHEVPNRVLVLPPEIEGLKARKILSNAFFCCELVDEIVVSEGYTEIDYEAFAYSSIKKITIPSSMEYIDSLAFRGCMSLDSIIIDPRNEKYDSRHGCNAVIVTRLNHLIVGCRESDIVPGVESIEYSVFVYGFAGRVREIILPGTITEISGADYTLGTARCLSTLSSMVIENPKKILGLEYLIKNTVSPKLTLHFPRKYRGIKAEFVKNRCDFRYHDTFYYTIECNESGLVVPKLNEFGENSYQGVVKIYEKVYDINTERVIDVVGIDDFAFSDCKNLMKVIIPEKIRNNVSPLAFINFEGEIIYE